MCNEMVLAWFGGPSMSQERVLALGLFLIGAFHVSVIEPIGQTKRAKLA